MMFRLACSISVMLVVVADTIIGGDARAAGPPRPAVLEGVR